MINTKFIFNQKNQERLVNLKETVYKNFKIPDVFKKNFIILDNKKESVDKAEWKNILTEFNVLKLVSSNKEKSNFLKLIFQVINDVLNEYKKQNSYTNRQILFFYKGGNIMRILAKHFNKQHNIIKKSEAIYRHEFFNRIFSQYFKKSDDDFSIMIDFDNEEKFNEVLSEVNYIINECLAIIRDDLEEKKSEYFSFFKKSEIQIKIDLQEVLEKMNKSNLITNEKSKYYGTVFESILFDNFHSHKEKITRDKYGNIPDDSKRNDYVIYYEDDKKKELVIEKKELVIGSEKHLFYNFFNSTLSFTRSGKITSFDLFRTKANFICFYTSKNKGEFVDLVGKEFGKFMNLGGEMIDISISKFHDNKRIDFFTNIEKNGLEKYVSEFTVNNDGSPYNITSITIDYMIDDLNAILFSEKKLPWDDLKYTKRLPRLFFLYICKILQEIALHKIEFEEFKKLFNFLNNSCANINNYLLNINNQVDPIIHITNRLNLYSETILHTIFHKLVELLNIRKELITKKIDYERIKKQEFDNSINHILGVKIVSDFNLIKDNDIIHNTINDNELLSFSNNFQIFIDELRTYCQITLLYVLSFSNMDSKFFELSKFLDEDQFGGKYKQSGGKYGPKKRFEHTILY